MKKFTFLWGLLLCFSASISAQHLSTEEELEISLNAMYNSESQAATSASLEELLTRLSDIGTQPNGVQEFFSRSEVQTLRAHFRGQNRDVMADIIPTAGAVETFTPDVGDFFFDPGGPGGGANGEPGNYPNCGCVTETTLDGVTEIEFLDYEVNGTFDWLRVYDGSDSSGTILFDNSSGGINQGDDTFAELLASNGGSGVFTGTSGAFFFEFNASAVVNRLGWEVEILATGGGGGGGNEEPTAFGINNAAPSYGSLDPTSPAVFTNISAGSGTPDFEGSGAIDPNDNDTGYVIDNFGEMWSVDVLTGVYTSLGNIGVNDMTGLEFNPVDGILYGITTTDFYSIDIGAVSATLIGSLGVAPGTFPIALAIDGDGNAYTYEIVDDIFYSIDTSTGAVTAIGPIGFDANFGQGMAWDAETDQVYMAAFNNVLFDTEWRIVDTSTGSTTLVGTVIPGTLTQMGWVSVINAETTGGGGGNNWECADAIALECGDVETGTTSGATNSGGNGSPDVFYSYTGTGDAELVTISLCDGGTTYDSLLRVFESCGNLTLGSEVALNDDFCGLQSQLTFESDGVSTYIIMVEGFGTGSGDYSLAITCELAPVAECGGQFVDSGGPSGNYSNNEDITTTILPDTPDDYVIVTFTEFDVESNWDALYVYDGPDTSAPLISSGNPPTTSGFPAGGYYGTTIPGPFASTHPSGALTFRFLSDGSVPRPGWVADITCLPVPPPNDLIVNAIDVDEFAQPYTDPAVRLQYATNETLNPQGCAIAGTNGVWYKFTAEADGTAEGSVVDPSGVTAVIFYQAPNENVADETELTFSPEATNQCGPGNDNSITTVAGQSYYVFVLNTGGPSDVIIDLTETLSAEDNTIDGFTFYPNPAMNVINVSASTMLDNVSMYNMLGQKVLDQNIGATTSQLDVANLASGTYLMKVSAEGQTGTYQIIKR
tara:strand:- start:207688 stop:210510 length:2823 start_codon:yes stop_codon:yes gene_type:complete